MNFFRGFSLNTTCSFLVFSLGFVNSVLLADQLGPEHYGTLRLWAALVMLGVLFLGEWLSKGNIYVVGREREREAAINHTLLYCLVLGALLLLTAPFSLALAKVFVPQYYFGPMGLGRLRDCVHRATKGGFVRLFR